MGSAVTTKFPKVYINSRCVSVGFKHVRKDFRINAERFKVQDQAASSDIFACLQKSPPTSDVAQKCFEYLFDRVQSIWATKLFCGSIPLIGIIGIRIEEGRHLEQADIRFVSLEAAGKYRHVTPTECYLAASNTPHYQKKKFFYVHFTTGAYAFLQECDSRKIPTASEIADLLFTHSSTFYRELNYRQYPIHLCSRGHLTQNTVDYRELCGIAQKLESDDQEGQLEETSEGFKDRNISPSLLVFVLPLYGG